MIRCISFEVADVWLAIVQIDSDSRFKPADSLIPGLEGLYGSRKLRVTWELRIMSEFNVA